MDGVLCNAYGNGVACETICSCARRISVCMCTYNNHFVLNFALFVVGISSSESSLWVDLGLFSAIRQICSYVKKFKKTYLMCIWMRIVPSCVSRYM